LSITPRLGQRLGLPEPSIRHYDELIADISGSDCPSLEWPRRIVNLLSARAGSRRKLGRDPMQPLLMQHGIVKRHAGRCTCGLERRNRQCSGRSRTDGRRLLNRRCTIFERGRSRCNAVGLDFPSCSPPRVAGLGRTLTVHGFHPSFCFRQVALFSLSLFAFLLAPSWRQASRGKQQAEK
jgi:hypothetical protein